MKRTWISLLLSFLAVVAGSALARADFRDPSNPQAPAGIWPEIAFMPAGDFKNFTDTISQSRDQVRKMLWREFGDLLIPLVQSGADAESTAKALADILLTFDQMHERHKIEANRGIPQSLEAIFRAEFDELHARHGISDRNRKAEFVRNTALLQAVNAGAPIPQSVANSLYAQVEFYLYGSYTILSRGRVEITLTLERYLTGQSRSFSASGEINEAVKLLARRLFDFFQSNKYPDWMNPQPSLEWVKAPATQPEAIAATARLYCRGQNARVPYARELILAAQGSSYLSGGIAPLEDGKIYLVADRQRWDLQHYYFAGQEDATGGPIRTDAGYGTIKASFWCVRGSPIDEIRFIEDLYRLWRKSKSPSEKNIRAAIEYILTQLEDYGARSEYRDSFGDIDEAIATLQSAGVVVRVPSEMRLGGGF